MIEKNGVVITNAEDNDDHDALRMITSNTKTQTQAVDSPGSIQFTVHFGDSNESVSLISPKAEKRAFCDESMYGISISCGRNDSMTSSRTRLSSPVQSFENKTTLVADDAVAKKTTAAPPPVDANNNNIVSIEPSPLRPLSAYNLFFRMERKRILNESDHLKDNSIKTDFVSPDVDADSSNISDTTYISNTSTATNAKTTTKTSATDNIMSISENGRTDRRDTITSSSRAYTVEVVARFVLTQREKGKHSQTKRKHVKTHGKIGFADLARNIASRWKNLTQGERDIFHGCSNVEMNRYKHEVQQWKMKHPNVQYHIDDFNNNNVESEVGKRSKADGNARLKKDGAKTNNTTKSSAKKYQRRDSTCTTSSASTKRCSNKDAPKNAVVRNAGTIPPYDGRHPHEDHHLPHTISTSFDEANELPSSSPWHHYHQEAMTRQGSNACSIQPDNDNRNNSFAASKVTSTLNLLGQQQCLTTMKSNDGFDGTVIAPSMMVPPHMANTPSLSSPSSVGTSRESKNFNNRHQILYNEGKIYRIDTIYDKHNELRLLQQEILLQERKISKRKQALERLQSQCYGQCDDASYYDDEIRQQLLLLKQQSDEYSDTEPKHSASNSLAGVVYGRKNGDLNPAPSSSSNDTSRFIPEHKLMTTSNYQMMIMGNGNAEFPTNLRNLFFDEVDECADENVIMDDYDFTHLLANDAYQDACSSRQTNVAPIDGHYHMKKSMLAAMIIEPMGGYPLCNNGNRNIDNRMMLVPIKALGPTDTKADGFNGNGSMMMSNNSSTNNCNLVLYNVYDPYHRHQSDNCIDGQLNSQPVSHPTPDTDENPISIQQPPNAVSPAIINTNERLMTIMKKQQEQHRKQLSRYCMIPSTVLDHLSPSDEQWTLDCHQEQQVLQLDDGDLMLDDEGSIMTYDDDGDDLGCHLLT